ncbi:MAG TPA: hypothetical protein PK336_00405 [Methanoculleus sp.]|nr:hypothetical protein [Methanoculleus sp.]HQP71045.1 hypothetical protein [Methanoculleus sp.]
MTGDTDRRETRGRHRVDDPLNFDDIIQFEWNDFLDGIMQTGDDDLLVIDDQTREVIDYLGHAPLEDIMRFEWNDFLDGRKADTDEGVERPVRRRGQ